MISNLPRYIRHKGKKIFDHIKNDKIKTNILLAIPFWIASLMTGIAAVAYTKVFGYAENLLQTALHWHSWSILLLMPACFFIAWYFVTRFSPFARGSGIPQVMAAIDLSKPKDDHKISGLLSFKVIVIKVISSFFMVLGGGAIGREGPTIQIASSIFRIVNRAVPQAWPKLSKKSYFLTGAAAGLAAAFNAPLGGIVFAVEELARIHLSLFRTALFTAVIVAGLASKSILGPYLYLGYPDVNGLDNWIIFSVVAAAIATGLLGGITGRFIYNLNTWRKKLGGWQVAGFILASGLLLSMLAYGIDPRILGSGKDTLNQTLFSSDKTVPFYLVIFRILGPALSFNIGAAGGIFAPSLAAGAAVGGFLSGIFGFVGSNANILILSGMVGFLTGITRTPFTSAILVLEMTDRHSVIVHLILAAMVSHITALLIDKHSLYDRLKSDYLDELG